jgi:acyl carrier protein
MQKTEFRAIVIDSIMTVTDMDSVEIRDDEDFTDYGIDSLDNMNLQLEIEKRLGHPFAEDFDMLQHNSIDQLFEYIENT